MGRYVLHTFICEELQFEISRANGVLVDPLLAIIMVFAVLPSKLDREMALEVPLWFGAEGFSRHPDLFIIHTGEPVAMQQNAI